MNNKLAYLLILFCLYFDSHAPQLTITEAGNYPLGGDIAYAPTTTDNIITVSVSNVVLDLGGRVLSQTNAVAGLTGILVNPNLSNVTIQNGTIFGLTGTGISVSPGCSRVLISNVVVSGCAQRGINITGASNNLISSSEIRGCTISNCSQSTTGDYALTLSQCVQITVNKCNFYGNGNTTFSGSDTIHMEQVMQSVLQDLFLNGNVGTSYNCVSLFNNVQDTVFKNCFVVSCSAISGITMNAFAMPAGSGSITNVFDNCLTSSCQITTGTFNGFLIDASNNTFNNCSVTNCATIPGTFNGFIISNSSTVACNNCNVNNNAGTGISTAFSCLTTTTCSFINCIASNNASTTLTVAGFSLAGTIGCNLIRCLALNNRATAGVAEGFILSTNPTGNSLQDCIAARNIGSSAANSFGYNFSAGTGLNNTFIRNTAMSCGTTSANLFSGFTATNQSATSGTATNVTNAPWTNVGITG
jgi:hypothetical protein